MTRSTSSDRLTLMVSDCFDLVWRSVRRFGVPQADTDDATQDVFMIASRRLDDIEVGRERAFLIATAVRVASTRRRSTRRRSEVNLEHPEHIPGERDGPEDLLARRRAREALDTILDEMDDDARVVFALFELEELPAPRIAEYLDIPVGTVASRLRRARATFHAAVKRLRARERKHGGRP
ncbi:MAG: sigma-70 family RNA polymerase sigma factor [Polyangiaceae bacterium]|nr:sigma-70 family RNA polymerase sigma factor [Polyangiaceae bacterium]